MPNELQQLSVDEVSLVDAPANSSTDPRTGRRNPHARVALWKRDTGGGMDGLTMRILKQLYPPLGNVQVEPKAGTFEEFLGDIKEMKEVADLGDDFQDKINALCQSVWTIISDKAVADKADKQNAINEQVKAFTDAVSEIKDLQKAVAGKTYGGVRFPASDFAYTPDKDKPSTWKLRLTSKPGGKPDAVIVGAACAALGAGFRGRKVDIPDADRPAVVARVREAWRQANPDKGDGDMPEAIKKSQGDNDMPAMTLDEITKKIGEQDALLATLKADNDYLKKENDVVTKMTKKERKAYASMDSEKQKEYMAGDAEKRKAMCDTAMSKLKEKAAEDCMDEATKAEYRIAGPVEKAAMLAESIAKMEKAKKAKGGKDGAATDDNGGDDEDDDDNQDEETVKMKKRLGDLTDRVVKTDAELLELRKKDRLNHFIDLAKRETPNGTGTDVEKASELMELAEKCGGEDTALFKSLFGRLKAADKALSPMFVEKGANGSGGSFQAEKALESIAKSIQTRDKLDYSHAYEKAMIENPQLYQEYEQQQRSFARQA